MWKPPAVFLIIVLIGILGYHFIEGWPLAGEELAFNPSPDIKMEIGDILLVLGDEEQINNFQNVYLVGASP